MFQHHIDSRDAVSAGDVGSVLTGRPSVTAIIATRNRADLLREALDSIHAQEGLGTQFDIEVVVVDDASEDNTAQVVAGYPLARCIRLPVRRRHPTARNIGIKSSSGKYVAFLDDDDLWLPTKLTSQVTALEAHPEADVAYSPFIISAGGQQSVFPEWLAPSGMLFNQLLFVNLCGNPAGPLVRREALVKVGGFSEDLMAVEDYDLWLRLSFHAPFIFVPGPVAVYRQATTGNMLSTLRSGEYDKAFAEVIERALALLPDTKESGTLKHQVRANRQLRLASLLQDHAAAWERLRAGVTMWPTLALNPGNRMSIAHIIAEQAMTADSPVDTATRLWREINDLQGGLGRRDRATMRRLLAAAYWRVGIIEGKGIGRSINARDAVGAIVRSIMLDPAVHKWGALLGFVGRRLAGRRTT